MSIFILILECVAYDCAVWVGEDGVTVVGRLAAVTIIFACSGHTCGVCILSKNISNIHGVGLDFLDGVGWKGLQKDKG